MKYLLIILVLLAGEYSYAQSSKDTVEYFMDYGHIKCNGFTQPYYYRLAYREGNMWRVKDYYLQLQVKAMEGVYSIYANDTFTNKQGMFFYYYENGKLQNKVRYVNDLKQGIEKGYDTSGNIIDSSLYKNGMPFKYGYKWNTGKLIFKGVYDTLGTGTGEEWQYYEDGKLWGKGKLAQGYKKDSVWIFNHENGTTSSIESYDNDSLITIACFDSSGIQNSDDCAAEKMPRPHYDLMSFFGQNMHYPDDARDRNVQGRITLRFVVYEDGSIHNVKVMGKYIGHGLEEEGIRLLSLMPKWSPGKVHNRVVKVYFTQPLTFRLE